MEDAYATKQSNKTAYFGVFDGHGGKQVADLCASKLIGNISKYGIRAGFAKTQAEIEANKSLDMIGSTANVGIFENGKLYIANCGDSRAVLCRGGKTIPLSFDHKPDRPDELARISKLQWEYGAKYAAPELKDYVKQQAKLANGGCFTVPAQDQAIARLQGILAVSRSMGDAYLTPCISSQPDITETRILKDDEFVIIACDGVWDVFTNEEAVDVVKYALDHNGHNFIKAAEKLRDQAYERLSADNITAMVLNIPALLHSYG